MKPWEVWDRENDRYVSSWNDSFNALNEANRLAEKFGRLFDVRPAAGDA